MRLETLFLKVPVIKQAIKLYKHIFYNRELKKYEKHYINEYETQDCKHIWGIKSWDDLSSNDCNIHTMNDFDITYHKDTDDYSISIETIYTFRNEDDEKEYIRDILDQFTKWMKENGYSTENELNLYEVFTESNNINTHFKSIEDCYTYFKMLVNGYCSL